MAQFGGHGLEFIRQRAPAESTLHNVQGLYGRADVLERARLGVAEARAGHGRLLLFTGEPGIGKSRLLEQLAGEAAASGARLAVGRCWEAGGAPAYWPWIQVFRELGIPDEPSGSGAAPLGPGGVEARFAAFDRAVRALRAAAREAPLALVLDDLHAADAPSLLLLLLLSRELARAPIVVLGAYRDSEASGNPELGTLLAKIARQAQVTPLSRLSPEAVASWANEAWGGSDARRSEELYRVTEGHPLFVAEVLRLGARDARATLPVGPGVLDEHLGALSSATRGALEVAAVLGREFSAGALSAAADLAPDQVFDALREALAASVVVRAAAQDSYRFSHVLLRDRLYDELLPSLRAALHWRAGNLALAAGVAPAELIHHLFEGERAGDAALIAQVGLAAARAELSRLAFEDAARIGRRALALTASAAGASSRAHIELQLVIAEAIIRLGEIREGQQLCIEAAALAEQTRDADLVAQAALAYGTELKSGLIDQQMIALLRRALERLEGEASPLLARVMARLAAALTPPVQAREAPEIRRLIRTATRMARALEDPDTLLYVLQFGATVALLVPDHERFSAMTEAMELARALERRLVLLSMLPAYVTTLLAQGLRDRAEAELPAYDQLLEDFRQPLHRLRRALVDSLLALFAGDFETAEHTSREAHDISQKDGALSAQVLYLTHRLSHAQLLARPDLVAPLAGQLLAHFENTPSAVPYATWLAAASGRDVDVLGRLQQCASLELEQVTAAYLMELMGAAETCIVLDRRELGIVIYPRLERAADRMMFNLGPGSLLGPSARVLGDLATLLGRTSDALRHYDDCIAFAEKLRSPPLLELCRAGRERALASALPPRSAAASTAPGAPLPAPRQPRLELRREGELWTLVTDTGTRHLRPSKGLVYLERLLARPGRQVHVLELAGIEHAAGDAGAVLDPRAKAEYRRRLDDLGEGLREAEAFGDGARARRLQAEIDALAEQLATAVGLGGRDRRAASDVERTRVNVQRRLKDAIDRVSAVDAALGRYLAAAVKTGTYCVYQPL